MSVESIRVRRYHLGNPREVLSVVTHCFSRCASVGLPRGLLSIFPVSQCMDIAIIVLH